MNEKYVITNSGPPEFTEQLSNISLIVGQNVTFYLPKMVDPDGDAILSPLIDFGEAAVFVSGSYPKYSIKVTD